jgi:hypothetical protein
MKALVLVVRKIEEENIGDGEQFCVRAWSSVNTQLLIFGWGGRPLFQPSIAGSQVVSRCPPYRYACYLCSLNVICPSSTNHDPRNSWET